MSLTCSRDWELASSGIRGFLGGIFGLVGLVSFAVFLGMKIFGIRYLYSFLRDFNVYISLGVIEFDFIGVGNVFEIV